MPSPQLPTTFAEALPEPLPAPFVNTLYTTLALALIAGTWQAAQHVTPLTSPTPPVATFSPLPVTTSAPTLTLALATSSPPAAAPATQLIPLATHVTQALINDQLGSIALKLSLTQQVAAALFSAR